MKISSKDGTQIAFTKTGKGSALILVGGAFCYRQNGNTQELAKLLGDHFTVYDYDRRGRGESTDTKPYSVGREIEDLNALVHSTGETPFVCGFSSGCGLVLRAMDHGLKFRKVALYEPPFVAINDKEKLPVQEVRVKLEKLISDDKKAKAVGYFLKRVVGVPDLFILMFRFFNRAGWKNNEGVVRTLLYDLDIMGDLAYPAGLASQNASPVLVIGGEKSPDRLKDGVKNVANHVPNSARLFLKGQTHNVSVKVLAPVLIQFFK
jgi:pimeloyl-ACP methyl ester carboxylesterase